MHKLIVLALGALLGCAAILAQDPKTVSQNDNEPVYEAADIQPTFPGGVDSLVSFLGRNLRYPPSAAEERVQGRVLVRFVVNKDGRIMDAEVLRGVHRALDAEALRVVRSMPYWEPGQLNGRAVNVSYVLPISFRL